MKKLISLLLVLLASALLLVAPACTQSKDTINIGILQVATHSALDNARLGFKEVLNEWAKQNGKTIVYDEQNANGDPNNEVTIAESMIAKNPNLVLGIATSSARALANATGDIPVLFTAVTAPEEENLLRSNVTGTSDMNPVAEQIALIKAIKPNAQKIAFLYNSSENNSVIQYELAKAKAIELGVELVAYTASLSSEISTVVDSISADIDAVYVPTDNLMAENMQIVCSSLHAKGIPVIPGESGMCEVGEGMATLGIDYYELGKQTAQMAIAILNGEKTAGEITFEYYNKAPSFYINETNAKTVGLTEEQIQALKDAYAG